MYTFNSQEILCFLNAGVAKLVDAFDLRSNIRKDLWVRFPPPAPSSWYNAHVKNMLLYSSLGGIVSFVMLLSSFFIPVSDETTLFLVALDIIGLIGFIVYIYGFAILGIRFDKQYLALGAYAVIALNITLTFVSYFGYALGELMFGTGVLAIGLAISFAMIVIGLHVLQLKEKLGSLAIWYGALEIVSAIGIIGIFSSHAGVVLDLVLYALGSLIFYRAWRG